jgi:hypothetical protein
MGLRLQASSLERRFRVMLWPQSAIAQAALSSAINLTMAKYRFAFHSIALLTINVRSAKSVNNEATAKAATNWYSL